MYPKLFPIFGIEISTFGLMLAVAFLVGTWIGSIRMREEGIDPELSTVFLLYIMLGGILGGKLYFAIDVSIREGLGFWSLLFSRDGITFYGGLAGGFIAAYLACRIHSVPFRRFANCMAVVLAVGQAIGRIGCFLVGDDYGKVTDLPWGIAFPDGAPPTVEPVHPTQLYEMAWLFLGAWVLWRRRHVSPLLIGEYAAWNGLGRFVIEFWRVNQPVVAGFTEAQLIAVGLVLLGAGTWFHYRRVALPAAT